MSCFALIETAWRQKRHWDTGRRNESLKIFCSKLRSLQIKWKTIVSPVSFYPRGMTEFECDFMLKIKRMFSATHESNSISFALWKYFFWNFICEKKALKTNLKIFSAKKANSAAQMEVVLRGEDDENFINSSYSAACKGKQTETHHLLFTMPIFHYLLQKDSKIVREILTENLNFLIIFQD